MILNTGNRTDIPTYYSRWFYNRIREGFVMARNPYNPTQVIKYVLDPDVVDVIVFCTKDPAPMLGQIASLSAFDTFWFVTVTPYGKDIEPFVPEKEQVMDSFRRLSDKIGPQKMSWRYDPILITEKYSVAYHIAQFQEMAKQMNGYTGQCVVSFLDLYEKTKRNFREARNVMHAEQRELITAMGQIAEDYGLQIHLCCESSSLVRENVDADGCLSKEVLEKAIGCKLDVPKKKSARDSCECLLGADIGAYNTCGHGCLYCYANDNRQTVIQNMKYHDADSPLLIGALSKDDIVKQAEQKSWKNRQMSIFDMQ